MMRLGMLVALMIMQVLGLVPSQAVAAETATWQGDIAGVPAWITVVPRGHYIPSQVRTERPWWEWGNTSTDTYLFAIQRPDNVRLILVFEQQASGLPLAKIYVNALGQANLDYTIEEGIVKMHSNSGYPYLTIRPDGQGWLVGDKANYNLTIEIDGPYPGFGFNQAVTDGTSDTLWRVGGVQTGIPDWETLRLTYDPYPSRGYPRFGVAKRLPSSPPFKVTPPFMPPFPYLGMGLGAVDTFGESTSAQFRDLIWFKENPNPILFDVQRSLLFLYSFPGFETGGLYMVNSLSYPPAIDFESPFVFYNFDPTTRYAHLTVRAERFQAGNQFGRGDRGVERTSFRYSWKTLDDARWKYSLHFSGFYTITQEMQIDDITFLSSPAEQLPTWIVTKPWPVTTFVEAIDGYPGSEGIYHYSAQSSDNRPFLDGIADHSAGYLIAPYLQDDTRLTAVSFETMPVGFRGEYYVVDEHPAQLYMSPVDGRLHLLYAQGGVWNIGHDQVLRMHNLNGDAYIDGWTREAVPPKAEEADFKQALPGPALEALYMFDGYAIYSGPDGSELRRTNNNPVLFQIDPPTDKTSWQAFRQRLDPFVGQERDPADLKTWLRTLSGETLMTSPGRIIGVRAVDRGFRFVIDLQPGFAAPELPQAQHLKSGAYVVTYDGTFSIAPLTPPALSVSLTKTPLTTHQPGALQVALRNDGLQDVPQATLEVWAAPQGQDTTLVVSQTVALLAQVPITSTLTWAAPRAGHWMMTPKIRQPDGQLISFDSESVIVLATKMPDTKEIIGASTSPLFLIVGIIGLATFAGLTALSFWRQSRRSQIRQVHDAADQ